MRELLDNLAGLMDARSTPRETLDLNRCLSRVACVMRAVVPPGLRIAECIATVPMIHRSVPAIHLALISLLARAVRALGGPGLLLLTTRTDGGAIEPAIHPTGLIGPPGPAPRAGGRWHSPPRALAYSR